MNPRIIILALAAFLVTGCGGGGGPDDHTTGDTPPTLRTGEVQIQFQRRISTETEEVFLQSLDVPSTVRVVVRNPDAAFRVIEEYPVPETVEARISVPIGDGYVVSGISYREGATLFNRGLVLKVGEKDSIQVLPGVVTNVSLVLEYPTTTFDIPTSAKEGAEFQVSLEENEPFFRRFIGVWFDKEPFSHTTTGISFTERTSPVTLNAPSRAETDTFYILGRVGLDQNYLRSSENYTTLQYVFPNPALGSGPATMSVEPEEGEIGIVIVY